MEKEAELFDTEFSAAILSTIKYLDIHLRDAMQPLFDFLQNRNLSEIVNRIEQSLDLLRRQVVEDKGQISGRFEAIIRESYEKNTELQEELLAEEKRENSLKIELKALQLSYNRQTVRLTKLFQNTAFLNFVQMEKKRETERSSLYQSDMLDLDIDEQIFKLQEENLKVKELRVVEGIVFVVESSTQTMLQTTDEVIMTEEDVNEKNEYMIDKNGGNSGSFKDEREKLEIMRLRKLLYNLIQERIPGVAEDNEECVDDEFVLVMNSIYDRLGIAEEVEKFKETGEVEDSEERTSYARLASMYESGKEAPEAASSFRRDDINSLFQPNQRQENCRDSNEMGYAHERDPTEGKIDWEEYRNNTSATLGKSENKHYQSSGRLPNPSTVSKGIETDEQRIYLEQEVQEENDDVTPKIDNAMPTTQEDNAKSPKKHKNQGKIEQRTGKSRSNLLLSKGLADNINIANTSVQLSRETLEIPRSVKEKLVGMPEQLKDATNRSGSVLKASSELYHNGNDAFKAEIQFEEQQLVESQPDRKLLSSFEDSDLKPNKTQQPEITTLLPDSNPIELRDHAIPRPPIEQKEEEAKDALAGSFIRSKNLYVDYKKKALSVFSDKAKENDLCRDVSQQIIANTDNTPKKTIVYSISSETPHIENLTIGSGDSTTQTFPTEATYNTTAQPRETHNPNAQKFEHSEAEKEPATNQECMFPATEEIMRSTFDSEDQQVEVNNCDCEELNAALVELSCVLKENELIIGLLRALEHDIMDEKLRLQARKQISEMLQRGRLEAESVEVMSEQPILVINEREIARRQAMLEFVNKCRGK